jgi:hypothetical protein
MAESNQERFGQRPPPPHPLTPDLRHPPISRLQHALTLPASPLLAPPPSCRCFQPLSHPPRLRFRICRLVRRYSPLFSAALFPPLFTSSLRALTALFRPCIRRSCPILSIPAACASPSARPLISAPAADPPSYPPIHHHAHPPACRPLLIAEFSVVFIDSLSATDDDGCALDSPEALHGVSQRAPRAGRR